MAGVRTFRREDIPGVVALRHKCFSATEQQDDASLAAYLQEVFFDSPWNDGDTQSVVFESKAGELAGFHGRLAKSIQFAGREGTMLVGTQLMADPKASGFPGVQLLRNFFKSDADLLLADAGNTESRGIWRSLGGSELSAQSMNWVLPLRPQYHLRHLGKSAPARVTRLVLRTLLDALAQGYRGQVTTMQVGVRDARAADVAALLHETFAGKALVPVLTEQQFAWAGAQLKAATGAVDDPVSRLVEDASGNPLGWYCMRPQRGGTARVLALHATLGKLDTVLDALCRDAFDGGAYALQGRVENWQLGELGARGCEFNRSAPWFLVYSREAKVLQMLHAGDARLTLLDGERSLRF